MKRVVKRKPAPEALVDTLCKVDGFDREVGRRAVKTVRSVALQDDLTRMRFYKQHAKSQVELGLLIFADGLVTLWAEKEAAEMERVKPHA